MSQNINREDKRISSALLRACKPAFILLSILAACVLVLFLINSLTADPIARHTEEKQRAAMASVMPGANAFSEMYCEDPTVDRISGAYAGTTLLGYCVEVSSNVFGGTVRVMVGVDLNGSITGVSVPEYNDTSHAGGKNADWDFLPQYIGKSGTVTVNTGRNAIQTDAGSAVTARAVTRAVNRALTAILNYDAEGGLNSEEHG